jgi:hypothetical protein
LVAGIPLSDLATGNQRQQSDHACQTVCGLMTDKFRKPKMHLLKTAIEHFGQDFVIELMGAHDIEDAIYDDSNYMLMVAFSLLSDKHKTHLVSLAQKKQVLIRHYGHRKEITTPVGFQAILAKIAKIDTPWPLIIFDVIGGFEKEYARVSDNLVRFYFLAQLTNLKVRELCVVAASQDDSLTTEALLEQLNSAQNQRSDRNFFSDTVFMTVIEKVISALTRQDKTTVEGSEWIHEIIKSDNSKYRNSFTRLYHFIDIGEHEGIRTVWARTHPEKNYSGLVKIVTRKKRDLEDIRHAISSL